MSCYIGIDLGGTNIAAGVVDENMRIIGSAKRKTGAHRSAREIARDMADTAIEAAADAGMELSAFKWIGVGTPGSVDSQTGVVGLAANLGFKNTPLAQLVSDFVGRPVYVDNDANAAAYGEWSAGAAKGLESAAVITLGTGVGGGLIIDGKIYSGFNGKGGELGHVGMVYGGEPCTCGRLGCIEAYCSVTALIRMTHRAMQANPQSHMWELAGHALEQVDGRTAFDAMRAGDAAAKQVVEQYMDYLAYAVSGIINALQPQAIVIGGGISKEGETLFGPVRERAYALTFNHDPQRCTQIVPASLGNDAGIIGAALLGKQYA